MTLRGCPLVIFRIFFSFSIDFGLKTDTLLLTKLGASDRLQHS